MTENSNEFGNMVRELLHGSRTTQSSVAASAGVDKTYVNKLVTGEKKPSAEWVDIVATALKCSPDQRKRLHLAAARDHGFKLDLTTE